jgi:predicted DNA-binding transcriptional regulator AlpA
MPKLDLDRATVMLTRQQVAARLGVGLWSLNRWIRCGIFPKPVRVGPGTWRWRLSVIDAFLRERERAAQTKGPARGVVAAPDIREGGSPLRLWYR